MLIVLLENQSLVNEISSKMSNFLKPAYFVDYYFNLQRPLSSLKGRGLVIFIVSFAYVFTLIIYYRV
jgi:hypothetical protein